MSLGFSKSSIELPFLDCGGDGLCCRGGVNGAIRGPFSFCDIGGGGGEMAIAVETRTCT